MVVMFADIKDYILPRMNPSHAAMMARKNTQRISQIPREYNPA